jgi:hypothetical protein
MRRFLSWLSIVLFVAVCAVPNSATQQSPLGPTATQAEVQTYEAFRLWITSQPVDVQRADDDVVYQRYAAALRAQGKSEKEATSTIQILRALGDRAEIERWNRILTASDPLTRRGHTGLPSAPFALPPSC